MERSITKTISIQIKRLNLYPIIHVIKVRSIGSVEYNDGYLIIRFLTGGQIDIHRVDEVKSVTLTNQWGNVVTHETPTLTALGNIISAVLQLIGEN